MKNKKSITVKTLSALGTIAAVATPIALVISCGSSTNHENQSGKNNGNNEGNKTNNTNDKKYAKDVVVSSPAQEVKDTFGNGNYANPQLTYSMDQKNLMEQKTRHSNGQPFSLHYHIEDVAQWKAGRDADDAFNVSTIPLKDRELAGKILANQKDKQLQILGSLSKNTSKNEAGTVGKNNINDAVFQMWSQITSFVSWGGSASEGNFVIPKGGDINAAHRNGVPLLGTLFLPPTKFGGQSAYYDLITKKDSKGHFPVADKMVEIANHFGFDGWFLNLESYNESSGDMYGFLKYFHNKMAESKLFTVLYDFGDGNKYMHDKDNLPFDTAALDYSSWGKTYSTTDEQRSYGYDYDKGSTTESNGKFVNKNIWLYTYFKRHDITDGDKVDLETFSDVNDSRDPRANANGKWAGLSKFFQSYTTINKRIPFSTSFETGIGSKFFVNGEEQVLSSDLNSDGYRNQGLQDVLPTYTWINDEYSSSDSLTDATRVSIPGKAIINDGSTWKVQIDETGTPFYGSSNLHYTGKISAGKTMINRLYGSNVVLKTGDKFSSVVDNSAIKTSLALWLQDKYDANIVQTHASKLIAQESKEDLGNGLTRINYVIPKELNGKTMSSFGLAFENNSTTTKKIDNHIGQLNFIPIDSTEKALNKVTSITPDGSFLFMDKRNQRVNWKMSDPSKIDHYITWSTKESENNDFTKDKILSVTSVPAANLKGVDAKRNLKLVIDAVDENDDIISSNKVVVNTSFKVMDDKSKWEETFQRETGNKSVYTIKTGHGYVDAFKDSQGNLYFADDNTRIHKVGADGTFNTEGTYSWGKYTSENFDDNRTMKIFEYDEDNIGVVTQDGGIHLLDKKTGEKKLPDVTTLAKYMSLKYCKKITSIKFAAAEDKKITLFVKGDRDFSAYIKIVNGRGSIIKNQVGQNEIEPTMMTKNEDGTVAMAYTQNGKIGIKQFSSVNSINLLGLSATSDISDGFEQFAKSDEYKGIFKADFIANATDAEFEKIAKGDIKLVRKLSNGNTLIVNSWGLAMTIDKDGKKVAITSIINDKTWEDFTFSVIRLRRSHGVQGFNYIGGDISLTTAESATSSLIGKNIYFDEKTNILQGLINNGMLYKWYEFAVDRSLFAKINLDDLVSGKSSALANILSEKEFTTEQDKTAGVALFAVRMGDVYVVAGSEDKIGIYDSDIKAVTLGQKIYKYDGKVVQSVELIYDNKDRTIPEQFLG